MCDENNQLPNSVPLFVNAAGGQSWGGVGSTSVKFCINCGQWFTGYHDCRSLATTPAQSGFNFYPQPERKPHVCPVCSGKGKVASGAVAEGTGGEECPACKGLCVLWG